MHLYNWSESLRLVAMVAEVYTASYSWITHLQLCNNYPRTHTHTHRQLSSKFTLHMIMVVCTINEMKCPLFERQRPVSARLH